MADDRSTAPPGLASPGAGAVSVAAGCSLAAGAIHLAASQTHGEHPSLARAILLLGAAQVLVGVLLLVRARRWVRISGAAISSIAAASWLVTRLVGLGWVSGLEVAEAPQLADTLAAALAVIALVALVRDQLERGAGEGDGADVRPAATRPLHPAADAALGAVAVLGLVGADAAGSHDHDHGDEAAEVDGDPATEPAWALGASLDEITDTAQLVRDTQDVVRSFTSVADAEAAGFVRINGDHLLHLDRVLDDTYLDPEAIESLVVGTDEDGNDYIRGGMYLMGIGETMRDVPRFGGPLMVWHSHGGFCFEASGVIAGLQDDGTCPEGSGWLDDPPMIHIYLDPQTDDGEARTEQRCGTFAYMDLPFDQGVPGCSEAIGHDDGLHAHH
ncbi:MAG: hypothetical protein KDA98_01130 [Acidimicrobiales bacterium]|nr:hypothetical protein [Acidimicrobiales bacterium]